MFGRAFREPVDDLRDPSNQEDLPDIMAAEFRNHNHRLCFLIRLIAASNTFRLRSDIEQSSEEFYDAMNDQWAVFPLV